MNKIPLVVDLDGTLIKTDMLFESLLGLIKYRFLYVLLVPFWLLKGRMFLKKKLASMVEIDVTTLPYNSELVSYLEKEKQSRRSLILATGTTEKYAKQIADHMKIFDEVISSNDKVNMSGSEKAKALLIKYGKNGFDYAGNEALDLHIWSLAANGILVNTSKCVTKKAEKLVAITHKFTLPNRWMRDYCKQLRVHQWAKNSLLFVSLFVGHYFNFNALANCFLGFLCFSLLASSVYIFNDLLDLPDDRKHKEKSRRPFAAGTIPVMHGLIVAPVLFLLSGCIAFFYLPETFLVVMIGYFLLSSLYSLYLKRLPILDVVVLAFLYTIRIVAGGVAIQSELSFWLCAFSIFIFLSLALVKRYSEIKSMNLPMNDMNMVSGRGYIGTDINLISQLGIASGYISVLVFALYINSEKVLHLYSAPQVLWYICVILLFWVSRVWLLANRGCMNEDPILFALKDKISLLSGLIVAILILISI